ncbi:adenylate/guanylate cyclase domain-containing protein [Sinorhizobium numidicum]|uniref:Adenylate/guanylate cyclase domain-containing protein n=1 Tax=Sinorhizobium numidicum TaxID=680248 RepID=A0ABY8CN35_9HYPH|nr:adenylate/guanylate cyclase domain-containing protein [Sinorhizobium numidicum]WEX74086.1 adenylate/guanylate cyclase domain-containing protein [Sinorhizobium numidicum]WEX80071.1 adenylate/guanylate cyclase domain-containing protein [Sinorhizobium numidicum]
MYRPKLGQVVVVLLLLAVLSTAALIHLIWQRAASENVEEIVASLDAQTAGSVRNDLSSTLALVSSTAEIVRSIFFQGAIMADDEVKREFLFLSLLREQPAIAWIGFGFPDGRFFGSHATSDGSIEMVEIGAAAPGEPRPLRRDLYRPIPGDIFFEQRVKAESAYVALGAPWYRHGKESGDPVWTVTNVLPNGFEPSIVLSKRVETFGKFTGVVMVAVSLRRLSQALQALNVPARSKAFVLDENGRVLATSEPSDGVMAAHFSDFPASDAVAAAAAEAVAINRGTAFRVVMQNAALGPVFVSSSRLPFENWRLVTATPRSTFAGSIDKNIRRIAIVVLAIAGLAAVTAVAFANLLFARPLGRLAAQLRAVERFSLESVRHQPTFLAELNDFSQALNRMSVGLSAFARYMPLDVVRPLVEGSIEPKPGGELCEITVMFADLPGFTELTERLGPGVEPQLTRFLTIAVGAVHAEGGTVDKFIGDAVMAIWNAPGRQADHAARACRAAIAIREKMHEQQPVSPEHDEVRVRIGINSGTALIGNIGSAERLSYTAIGDTVNLASRLVGVAKEHGVEIVLGEATARGFGAIPLIRSLGLATVRGKAKPVAIHTIDRFDLASKGGSNGNGDDDGGDARLHAGQAFCR